jgi:hypothetical protein
LKLKHTVQPIVEQIPYLPQVQILEDKCMSYHLAHKNGKIIFKLELGDKGFQENIDFGSGLHTFLDWY